MKKEQFISILNKHLENRATPEEENLLNAYYHLFMADADVLQLLKDEEQERLKLQIKAGIDERIDKEVIQGAIRINRLWPRIAAVAAILLVAGAGIFFYTNTLRHPDTGQGPEIAGVNDIAPGKFGATLTLANGTQIVLSDAKNGELVKESGVNITKTADGRIVYEILKQVQNDENSDKTNTLSTAKGETYQVRLPDGTSIWLNAASTLKYPASFAAHKNRRVELSGEAYFEVAKDKAHPFIVQSDKQDVEVLGTHFNINSYADEASTKTTLLEGSVAVRSRDLSSRRDDGAKLYAVVLKPNQQAILKDKGIKVIPVVGETYVDWKEGVFNFRKEELASIMRKVSRWYNVEIVYREVSVDGETYSGYVSRSEKVSGVLNTLAKISKLKFEIEKNKIIVSK